MFGHQDDQSQQDTHIPDQTIEAAMSTDAPAAPATDDWGHPGQPLDAQAPPATVSPTPSVAPAADTTPPDASVDANDLIDIKQQALTQLSPLVSHLDQNPEEKFRTLMMMIQASDDHAKIKEAYAAAQAITDEKTRAQALLDIVNEINYFTQAHES